MLFILVEIINKDTKAFIKLERNMQSGGGLNEELGLKYTQYYILKR